ncbi:homoserine kinase [Bacteriovorax sp. Seq25_V]|uniref:homoserine kinase n=1 Tax=Bacteriovorax sp. Seq25_V TaxID=1201288 RepID=UPI00038A3166|nr:homoserine kinase [Bacteriovorax sp. Seq25_V]EQC47142.1 phosphotransferase enzyme family protein [Bacteriovorax sp. Seq25_V]
MGDYTKLTISEIAEIFELYVTDSIESFRALSLGISNSNYEIITANNKYLLKVSNDKNKEQVLDEMRILEELRKSDYPYSIIPIKTLSGELVYEKGSYYGVLFPFVDGIPPGPGDSTCFEIGMALAKLHITKANTEGLRPSEELSYPASIIAEYSKQSTCPDDFKELLDGLLQDRLQKYLTTNFDKGIIHGDLYYDNTLFHNDHIVAVLDFEQSGVGEFILDLGISISGSCLEKGRISLPLMESYLRGYESVRPLPLIEKEFLNDAVILGLFSIALWRIKRFKEGTLNPLMADSYKQLLYRAEIFKQTVETND